MTITETHVQALRSAVLVLENPGLAAKITSLFGIPIRKGFELLPDDWSRKIGEVTKKALMKAADAAVFSIRKVPGDESSDTWHKLMVAATGGVSGFFGLPALAVELPITTTIILRSIAEIAGAKGESINDYDTKLACLEVFAMGGKHKSDDNSESGYFIVRTALARSVAEAAEFAATRSLTGEGAPALIKFIIYISQRFSIQVTEKVAAQAIPIIGAAGGAIINTLFIDHFQDMARGHFTVRHLEHIYGKQVIKEKYEDLIKENTK